MTPVLGMVELSTTQATAFGFRLFSDPNYCTVQLQLTSLSKRIYTSSIRRIQFCIQFCHNASRSRTITNDDTHSRRFSPVVTPRSSHPPTTISIAILNVGRLIPCVYFNSVPHFVIALLVIAQ